MCMSKPKYTAPIPPQDAKTPQALGSKPGKPGAGGMAGSTLLTGAEGIDSNTLKLGKSSLLGS
jgi:hypothetical protein